MADRAVSMEGFSQARFVTVFLLDVAFHTGLLFTLDINEFVGLVVLHMVTGSAPFFLKGLGVSFMGETDLRPSQLAENFAVGQVVISLLCECNRPDG